MDALYEKLAECVEVMDWEDQSPIVIGGGLGIERVRVAGAHGMSEIQHLLVTLDDGSKVKITAEKVVVVPEGVDAVLKQARAEPWGDTTVWIGKIYGDKKRRFFDGQVVHTSAVQRREGNIIYTKNSTYLIEPLDLEAASK